MLHNHQPGQATFRSFLPEDIDWHRSRRFTFGAPCRRRRPSSEPGPYVIRVKVPGSVKLNAAQHPEAASTRDVGRVTHRPGDEFDGDEVSFSAGKVIVLPGNTSHFHWGEIRRVRHASTADRPRSA